MSVLVVIRRRRVNADGRSVNKTPTRVNTDPRKREQQPVPRGWHAGLRDEVVGEFRKLGEV